MRRYLLCLVVLCLSSYLYADEEEVLRTEYQQFQKILESAEENYWKKKYSLIEMKQAAKDELEGFDNEYDNLLKMRNSLKEEILSLKIDNKDLKDNIDNYKMRISEIYDSCINKLDSLRKFVKRYHPLTTEIDLIRINDIRKMIERKEDFIKIGHMILSFLNTKISDSMMCASRLFIGGLFSQPYFDRLE